MAFLDKAGLQTLTNKLVQGDAIKVASSRGYTVKNVIDNITRECGDVENPQTMTLEDKTGHFIVGKGEHIDVSGDVEAGKMAFKVKGNTLISSSPSLQAKYFLSCSETDRPLIKDLVEGVNHISFEVTGRRSSWAYVDCGFTKNLTAPIQPNTKYTVVADIFKGIHSVSIRNGNGLEVSTTEAKIKNNMAVITTGEKLANPDANIIYLHLSLEPVEVEVKNLMLIEGDWTNKELLPFFTGIKSSFETEEERKIVHTGKNLWKWGDPTRFAQYTRTFSEPFMLAGHTYTISHGNITQYFSPNDAPNIRFASINGELKNIHFRGEPIIFTPKEDVKDVIIYSNGYNWAGSTGKFATIENFQIEEGRGATEYAPYTKEEKTIELDEPLRSLPNGVCDEITEDGRLIRRVGKFILDHRVNWEVHPAKYEKNIRFNATQLPIKAKYGKGVVSNRLPYFPIHSFADGPNRDVESITIHSNDPSEIDITISKQKIYPHDKQGFLKFIEANPITVYYERTEPKITDISSINFDVSQHSRIDLSSVITPITTYKVPLNRAAQIDSSIKTIQELKQRIELLEQAYDNHFLESQYKLSLLKLEHQIESEEI